MTIARIFAGSLLALATITPVAALAQAGDAVKGKIVFARCALCHDVKPGPKKMGPALNGLFGRTSGTIAGFTYSPAMQKAKIRWDAKTLDAFLAKPSAVVPGNRMAFAGVPQAADRANLIAYLKSATK
ncbi:cytochrome c family protein [Sphingobium sp. SA2]|mgnify:FL=1|jgi:cytochrome c|uniref:c-type cytochrome n=1 Tax=unclassified Sphingobium TaxID=2611147 RepID=UPI0005027A20|nr:MULTISPECIES: cytochrome c family protein [unclassified Sphingobium]AOF95267.1 cytochrome c domain protein [Sphingobium sp. RAC03]KFL46918.1 cytochrome c [Sphingobium sp. ba1]MDT7532385.1 cytochrome c family protein [Sphingobium sp. SA2]